MYQQIIFTCTCIKGLGKVIHMKSELIVYSVYITCQCSLKQMAQWYKSQQNVTVKDIRFKPHCTS